jgi:aerotaxis receptor
MQINLPISQREYDFPETDLLVSTTDTRGIITHCNQAFVSTSGYGREELIGRPHNIVRHPDMPAFAFKDMWRTIGRGQPWTGIVKNRRKNGDHYWVEANVTPIMENGKPSGYMSVRTKPSRAQVAQAEALYAAIRKLSNDKKAAIVLEGGLLARIRKLPLTVHLAGAVFGVAVLALLPDALGWTGMQAVAARAAILAAGLGGTAAWFHARFSSSFGEALRFASELSSCDLGGKVDTNYPEPLGALMRRLRQIQVNLRAVVGDVRTEIAGFTVSANEISQASQDLAARTESQASSLEETASSMEELASTVRQTADAALRMTGLSEQSTAIALRGKQSVEDAETSMEHIEQSSRRIGEVSAIIEGIAFQTNILALNAAVEAARAGEHGRGFAVVAGEVRSLAQRSAMAAKEIKQLIGEATRCTEEGAQKIRGAGGTLQEVMTSATQLAAMVQQIASATREQSLGISQVNEAVTQLDTVTQQNAALVEESAASALALDSSAQTLKAAVSVFRMAGSESAPSAARKPVAVRAVATLLAPSAA